MKNWKIWPFLVVAIVVLTVAVARYPEGKKRVWGMVVAVVIFPVIPLVGGAFSKKS